MKVEKSAVVIIRKQHGSTSSERLYDSILADL